MSILSSKSVLFEGPCHHVFPDKDPIVPTTIGTIYDQRDTHTSNAERFDVIS